MLPERKITPIPTPHHDPTHFTCTLHQSLLTRPATSNVHAFGPPTLKGCTIAIRIRRQAGRVRTGVQISEPAHCIIIGGVPRRQAEYRFASGRWWWLNIYGMDKGDHQVVENGQMESGQTPQQPPQPVSSVDDGRWAAPRETSGVI